MANFKIKDNYVIEDLLSIVSLLRDPKNGCPWDKAQTHHSIRQNFIEETYEVCDAIDKKDVTLLCEELGDVLLQIILHSQMEKEKDGFGFNDVCDGICTKLIYRHPHIFSDTQVSGVDEVLKNWDNLKLKEKNVSSVAQDVINVPSSLPALMRAKKIQKRAKALQDTAPNLETMVAELQQDINSVACLPDTHQAKHEHIGNMLFDMVQLSSVQKIDAELALSDACARFSQNIIVNEK